VSPFRLGLDLGGTKTALGVVTREAPEGSPVLGQSGCQVLTRRRFVTAEAGDGERLLERVAALAEEACAGLGLSPRDAEGIGMALPGPIDPATQRLVAAATLPGLIGYPVTDFLARRWGQERPGWVRAENDANAAALGEAIYGAGRGARVVCYFTVSTGIGGGVVVDGRLFRGATGQAAEFGHLKLRADGPPCSCGDRGCLEALASGTAIGRRAREAAAGGAVLGWLTAEDPAALTAERVAEAARRGDAPAARIWHEAMADLGAGIATVVNLFNPDVVVIGGGVSGSADLLLPALRSVVAERAMPALARAVRIEVAAFGADAGIVGAAALLEDRAN
jgi:glucokinase